MAELTCVFCKNSENSILFTRNTLMMCNKILNLRIKHNLEYQDVVLPGKELEGGYHKQCCIQFISLIGTRTQPASTIKTVKEEEFNPADNSPVPELSTQSTGPQLSIPVGTLISKPMILRQPIIKLERLELKTIRSGQNKTQLENINCNKKSLICHYTPKDKWDKYHEKALKKLTNFILKNVVKKKSCYFLTYLHKIYEDFLKKRKRNFKSITVERLRDEIIKALESEVKFFLVQNNQILVPKKFEDIDDELFEKLKEENSLLTNQFNWYQGNFQDKYYVDDEAENFDGVDIQD